MFKRVTAAALVMVMCLGMTVTALAALPKYHGGAVEGDTWFGSNGIEDGYYVVYSLTPVPDTYHATWFHLFMGEKMESEFLLCETGTVLTVEAPNNWPWDDRVWLPDEWKSMNYPLSIWKAEDTIDLSDSSFVVNGAKYTNKMLDSIGKDSVTYTFTEPGLYIICFYANATQGFTGNYTDYSYCEYIMVTDDTLTNQTNEPTAEQTPVTAVEEPKAVEKNPEPAPETAKPATPAPEQFVVASAPGTATVVNCNALNLRRGPGVSHAAFNHLLVSEVVKVLDQRGNWYKVEKVDGAIGWAYGEYLDIR